MYRRCINARSILLFARSSPPPHRAAFSSSVAARDTYYNTTRPQQQLGGTHGHGAATDIDVAFVYNADQTAATMDMEAREKQFTRERFENLLTRRMFYVQSFEIYGGAKGLFDYGPAGSAMKTNLLDVWRSHFVLEEAMLELDCTCLTPERVLVASGHVAKFNDFLVADTVTGVCHRADHVLEDHMEHLCAQKDATAEQKAEWENVRAHADDYGIEELAAMMTKYDIKAPATHNPLSPPRPFNLMFKTAIGPSGKQYGYLRPETAQGIFVNFKRLLEFNGAKLPMGVAQIGQAFRNEIAPRNGLLRVREFTLAEIEYFVKEDQKALKKFARVADVQVTLFSREQQDSGAAATVMRLGDAVASGLIDNETLGYFVGRTHLFLLAVGVDSRRLRFRQHLANEMAHYATDCWDAEIKTSYGWVECVGHADRGCFDLTKHADATNTPLCVFESYPDGPKEVNVTVLTINKGLVGKTFRKEAKPLMAHLEALDQDAVAALQASFADGGATVTVGGTPYTLTDKMVSFKAQTKRVAGETYVPHVIEPSFGIGRILYGVLEHSFWTREGDEARGLLSLSPLVAPIKCSVLPLQGNEKLEAAVDDIAHMLTRRGVTNRVDKTGVAIGRRYARTDEIGIPFGITVDFDTLEDMSVTLRERDTMVQVRVPMADVADVIDRMCRGLSKWSDVDAKYPRQAATGDAEEAK